ncbi:hypothetical protein VE04_08957 [Pseudogymnoascus sp. 24MN13]|nr:hypothetical protein VE04_08957 [Pseudogymnoascus sp. 24MN13]
MGLGLGLDSLELLEKLLDAELIVIESSGLLDARLPTSACTRDRRTPTRAVEGELARHTLFRFSTSCDSTGFRAQGKTWLARDRLSFTETTDPPLSLCLTGPGWNNNKGANEEVSTRPPGRTRKRNKQTELVHHVLQQWGDTRGARPALAQAINPAPGRNHSYRCCGVPLWRASEIPDQLGANREGPGAQPSFDLALDPAIPFSGS